MRAAGGRSSRTRRGAVEAYLPEARRVDAPRDARPPHRDDRPSVGRTPPQGERGSRPRVRHRSPSQRLEGAPGASTEWRLVRVAGTITEVRRSGERWTAELATARGAKILAERPRGQRDRRAPRSSRAGRRRSPGSSSVRTRQQPTGGTPSSRAPRPTSTSAGRARRRRPGRAPQPPRRRPAAGTCTAGDRRRAPSPTPICATSRRTSGSASGWAASSPGSRRTACGSTTGRRSHVSCSRMPRPRCSTSSGPATP